MFPEDRQMDKTERWAASKKQWPEEDPSGPLFPRELWTACGGVGGEGGRRGGGSQGLEPGFPLSGTIGLSKACLKQFCKHGLLSRF